MPSARFPARLAGVIDGDAAIRSGVLWLDTARDDAADRTRADSPLRWPLEAAPPRGAIELAAHARSRGRVTRAPMVAGSAAGLVDELLAIPLDGTVSGVLVLALDGADAGRREAIVREARGRSCGSSGPVDASPSVVDLAAADACTPLSVGPCASDRRVGARVPDPVTEARLRGRLDRAALDALSRHGDSRSVALAAADTIATLFGCHRVSLGVRDVGAVRPLAVSGESRPDVRRSTTVHLIAAMNEAMRDGGTRLPREDETGAVAADAPAHRRLRAREGELPLLSVVCASASGDRIVALLERPRGERFTGADEALATCVLTAALVLTAELHGRERGLWRQVRRSVRRTLTALTERRSSPRLVLTVIALAASAFSTLVPLSYRVGGRVVVEASDRQVLVAPEAGHIRTAHVRAGDTVAAGELLATLDDRELALAHDRWRSEAAKNRAEQARALAGRDRVELARLRADATRIEAEIGLTEARRERAEIRAPFAGVVLSGDPTRSLGAPVAAGDVLFEIGAGERSLSITVDERDIALVERGARARVRMAAAPREMRAARLESIVPVAVDIDGRQVFRVPAVLVDDGDVPSPGMQGVARIEAGRRTLASAWTRTLRERALLLAWRFGLVR